MQPTPKFHVSATTDDGKPCQITRVIIMPEHPNHVGAKYYAICNGEILVRNSPLAEFDACRILADRGWSGKVEFLIVENFYISARFNINECAQLGQA